MAATIKKNIWLFENGLNAVPEIVERQQCPVSMQEASEAYYREQNELLRLKSMNKIGAI